ncbi:sugar transferase, partial [Staphylococcus nepalensis]
MKRIFDILSASYAIFLFSPILLLVSIAIKMESKGPVIFKQDRPGIKNKLFKIYKFRSMRQNTPNVATDKLDPKNY